MKTVCWFTLIFSSVQTSLCACLHCVFAVCHSCTSLFDFFLQNAVTMQTVTVWQLDDSETIQPPILFCLPSTKRGDLKKEEEEENDPEDEY